MTHHFKVALAKEYGIEAAILIDEFNYQISRNKANERNFHDGKYWTYNTLQAYTDIFPYFSIKQIRKIIDNLISSGILMKGNYNENPYNRTSWYAFTDEGLVMLEKYYIHLPKQTHPFAQTDKCTSAQMDKCKTTTITTTITSISNTPSDEGSDRDLFSDADASALPMPTLVGNKLTAPSNKNVTSEESAKLFEELWMLYERKGNKQIAKNEFAKLNPTEEEIAKIRMHIPAYIEAQPEKKYRLDFERYIKRRTFESVVYSKDNAVLYDPDAEIQPKKSDADIKAPVNDSFYR